jgi:hypothetical protein
MVVAGSADSADRCTGLLNGVTPARYHHSHTKTAFKSSQGKMMTLGMPFV